MQVEDDILGGIAALDVGLDLLDGNESQAAKEILAKTLSVKGGILQKVRSR